jgi:hypothetical protein
VLLNDDVRVRVEFAEPRFAYLLAFNPNGELQPVWPADETQFPQRQDVLDYPPEKDVYFQLTDGRGQQAIVVLASAEPLPPWAEFRARLGKLPWQANHEQGVWEFADGKLRQIFSEEARTRGTLVTRTSATFRQLCERLREANAVTDIHAFAFSVE